MRYMIGEDQQPWLFVVFDTAKGSAHPRNAVVLFPEADHTVAFGSFVARKGWGLRKWAPIPQEGYGADRWVEWEIRWEARQRWLRVRLAQKDVLAVQLDTSDSLEGAWRFSLAGSYREVRIRDVRLVAPRT